MLDNFDFFRTYSFFIRFNRLAKYKLEIITSYIFFRNHAFRLFTFVFFCKRV